MFGSVDKNNNPVIGSSAVILKTVPKEQIAGGKTVIGGIEVAIPSDATYYTDMGATTTSTSDFAYVTFELKAKDVSVIEISASTFPGSYWITGDTYRRREKDGKDEFLQLQIPKAKVTSEVTLQMEAEGKREGLLSLNSVNCWKLLKIA